MSRIIHPPEVSAPAPPGRPPWSRWLDPGEPHPVRGPFSRWPRVADAALAVMVFAMSVVAVAASAVVDGEAFRSSEIGELPAGAVVILGLAAASLLWRQQQPIAVTAFVLVTMLVWAVAGYGDGHDLALVVALYSVGRYVIEPRWSLAAVTIGTVIGVLDSLIDTHQRIDVVPAVVLAVLPWYVGRRIRDRGHYLALLRERAERLEEEQHAEARQAVAEERARIARELHDVVAHRVSMMTVQAGAARTIAGDDLDAAVEAMGDVESAGRQALGELRHLLGVLRVDDAGGADGADELGPQPGLGDVAVLVDQLRRTGVDVTLTVAGDAGGVPAAVELSAYRIIQESLTNVAKHAGPEACVDLAATVADGEVIVDVVNTVAVASPGLPASGYGIAGMRERVDLLGGVLVAGPESPDRFRVRAHLPFETESP